MVLTFEVQALENADLALCETVHSYFAWNTVEAGQDLGSWIARASLVRQVPWVGCDFTSDKDYIASLKSVAKERVAVVSRALLVHN